VGLFQKISPFFSTPFIRPQVQALDDYETCTSHNRLVCSFAPDAAGSAVEVGAAATVTAYAGSYDYAQTDPTYACAVDPLVEARQFLGPTASFLLLPGYCFSVFFWILCMSKNNSVKRTFAARYQAALAVSRPIDIWAVRGDRGRVPELAN
jgi:hypothetical protein